MSTIPLIEESPRTQQYLQRAIQLAAENAANDGGPFGAIIVTADGQQFAGVNRVTAENDPTMHAEVAAIRAACRALGTFELSGAVLYTSCEPCPLCLSAALWARLDAVHFAADRHDAAAGGFDDAEFYAFFTGSAEDRDRLLPVRHVRLDTRTTPFDTWAANAARTRY
ncbi:tRNA-specific adenosine deaminase [Tersicoccus phoenicis]|uniref:tRNA-specific adenosine deaminase n=1 Tax=Tersicoccus phoenicis TaxID=554083 RepID=A0A1R1L7B3_9MICC|nr:nucleoside deaminase [Tersicoccus phoenicis]OMH23289.1 tRNA-specific adenosine deaminase [Tersicoccus phoenicis]